MLTRCVKDNEPVLSCFLVFCGNINMLPSVLPIQSCTLMNLEPTRHFQRKSCGTYFYSCRFMLLCILLYHHTIKLIDTYRHVKYTVPSSSSDCWHWAKKTCQDLRRRWVCIVRASCQDLVQLHCLNQPNVSPNL